MSDINDSTPDEDVEGHNWRPKATDDQSTDDVEGHTWRPKATDDDDDVEGHGISRPQAVSRLRANDDDDDVEGHVSRPR